MKTIVLALVLLSTTVFGQIKYSTTTELRNYKTNSTAGVSPVGADFGGKTIACLNTANHLVYLRPGLEIIPSYFMFPYKDGIGSTSPVVVTSYQRYGYPKFQYSVKTSDIYGNIPPRTDFTSPSIRCLNADGKMYYMVNGVVKIEWLIVPYSIVCEYVYSDWSDCSPNGIKTRTVVSQSPENCAGTPVLTAVCTYTPPPVVCTYVYTPWSSCDSNGIRTRTVINSYPYACTGTPVLIDSCEYVPPTCTYTYSAWSTCGEDGTRTRTVIGSSPSGCAGIPILIDSCIYVPPVCTYTYSDWGDCADGLKTRVVTDSTPSGCAGTPVLVQACEPVACTYTYSAWSPCDITGHRTRTLLSSSPIGCTGTPVLSETCTYVPPTCTYAYSAWSTCSQSGYQTRTVISSTPGGCQGAPILTQSCTYVPPVVPHGDHNYYVSSTIGNDNYTSTQAHSSATPWRTLGKISSFSPSMAAGDSVLFKKGDTFEGALILSCSGTVSAPIIISSYGQGVDPILSGFTAITGWTSEGNGIYSKTIAPQSAPTIVSVNNRNTPMGRFPNTGYLTIDSFVTNTTITDSDLNSSVTNWGGAEVVIRKNHWITDRCNITTHSGQTLSYIGGAGNPGKIGYGYFIQNDLRCLDVVGDWAYKSSKLYMYFGSNSLSNYSVRVPVVDKIASITNRAYITIKGLSFRGANTNMVYITGSNHIIIDDCDIDYSGAYGIRALSSSYIEVKNSILKNVSNSAIYSTSTYATFSHNTIDSTSLIEGMSGNGDGNAFAIEAAGNNSTVEYNSVSNSGYVAIHGGYNSFNINHNYVHNFCKLKDDGGAIYVYMIGTNTAVTPRLITDNIVINDVNASQGCAGTVGQVHGLYCDGYSANITLSGNTVSGCITGLYIQGYAKSLIIKNNLFYANTHQQIFINSLMATLPTHTIKNNILAANSGQMLINYGGSSLTFSLANTGTIDSNYYINPFSYSSFVSSTASASGKINYLWYSYQNWKDNFDSHAFNSPVSISKYSLNGMLSSNKITNGTFTSNTTGASSGYSTGGTAILSWDNTNKINGGSAKLSVTTLSTNDNYAKIIFSPGAIDANSKYILRFSVLGTVNNSDVIVTLQGNYSPYTTTGQVIGFKVGTSINTYEAVLPSTVALTGSMLMFKFNDVDCPIYLDDVEFYKADVTNSLVSDHILFDYSVSGKSVSGISWKDVNGNTVTGYTLPAYSSKLLIK